MSDDLRRTYDRIAEHFAATREYPWPEVEEFLDGRTGQWGLDVGCGNGRHTEVLATHVASTVGLDVSRGLLDEARTRATDRGFDAGFVQGDAAALPLPDDRFDLAVYVATLHHLRPRERRLASLDELARVLAPGGRAVVSAWATVHDRFADHHTPSGAETRADTDAGVDEGRDDDGRNASPDVRTDEVAGFDTHVDWTLPGGETVPRFYHIYAPAEFRADLDASRLRLESAFVSSGNCYAVVGGR